MIVPPALRVAMTAAHGAAGAVWCDRLPPVVDALATRWALTLETPFNATHHWVAPAGDAVLKVGWPSDERDLAREADVLAAWDGRGAVRLLDADLDVPALLLGRVRPGTDLLAMPDDEAFPLIGAVARSLHSAGHARPPLAIAAGQVDLRTGHPALPRALSTAAADLLEELLATTRSPVLCHGDLHHANVLRAPTGAVVIDPRGVWGDPALDVGVALLNPLGSLPGDRPGLRAVLERRLELICPAMGVDAERGRGWTVVSAVVSALWSAQDGHGPFDEPLAVARALL
jgi:streptomycin 6-kinase